jgi:hypothetical protein
MCAANILTSFSGSAYLCRCELAAFGSITHDGRLVVRHRCEVADVPVDHAESHTVARLIAEAKQPPDSNLVRLRDVRRLQFKNWLE